MAPSATFRLTWSTAVSFPYTFVRFSVTIALVAMEHLPLLRKDPHRLFPHLDHDPTELVRLLRGDLVHVRPEEFARGPELPEQRGPLGSDRGLEGAEPFLDLLATAPQVRLAFAGDLVGLPPLLAADGEIPFS